MPPPTRTARGYWSAGQNRLCDMLRPTCGKSRAMGNLQRAKLKGRSRPAGLLPACPAPWLPGTVPPMADTAPVAGELPDNVLLGRRRILTTIHKLRPALPRPRDGLVVPDPGASQDDKSNCGTHHLADSYKNLEDYIAGAARDTASGQAQRGRPDRAQQRRCRSRETEDRPFNGRHQITFIEQDSTHRLFRGGRGRL